MQGEAGLARRRYHDDGNDGQRVRETAVRRGSRRSVAFDGCRHARKKVKICFVRKKRLLYRSAIKKDPNLFRTPFCRRETLSKAFPPRRKGGMEDYSMAIFFKAFSSSLYLGTTTVKMPFSYFALIFSSRMPSPT